MRLIGTKPMPGSAVSIETSGQDPQSRIDAVTREALHRYLPIRCFPSSGFDVILGNPAGSG
jgi:hypothetical protein